MTVPSATELPALAPKAHGWEKSKTNDHGIQRRSIGAEAIVGLEAQNRRGQYDLYMVATLETLVPTTSATTLTLSYLKEKFELALLVARFQHPECAATVSWDEQVSAIISYQPPEDDEAALAWAEDCVHVQPTAKSAYDIWGELEAERSANNVIIPSKSFEVFLLANVPDPNACISAGAAVEVLIHTNHLFWDGISCRMFVGNLFRILSDFIGLPLRQTVPKFKWGQEVKNLSPPILDSLSINVETLGTEFDNKCKEYTSALVGNYSSRGLPFTPGLGLPRCELLTLSAENSKAIIKGIKTRLGPEFTITHLTQAAILLALLDALKPTDLADDEAFVTPTSVDGRRWMRPELAGSFYSMCQTAAVVRVENLKSIHVSHEDATETQVTALARACRDVKTSYDRWLKNPYQQALGLRVHNFEARYLQAAIRLDSWKDASTVSIIYNEANYTKAEVQLFLKSITDFMLAFMA
ncbi:hypothetical protein LLEC1_00640 [Akanthomyces lecanii]|uniref:Condensation domain-containing protein n=1 Tax=Cordyceps confragosa TaxID=2714763 RepID=A0A179I281_CORDF|nr:hypothetical protein LLEC1_00640 [Akanthomyces lecanii]